MLSNCFRSVSRWHGLMIAAIALILILPAIAYGVFDAHDLPSYHLRWSKQFAEQFWMGDFYPRWLLNMNAGLGSPTFFFYAPIPYFLTSLMRPLIIAPDPFGWSQLVLGAYGALVASGIAAYHWLKSVTNASAALIAAILYMMVPYHLAIDLYYRFAYAEFWSFVWFPLILYFSQKLLEGHRFAVVGIAIAEALLIMTHLPSFLMFTPVPILYGVWMAQGKQRRKVVIGLCLGFLLAIGLSAIYWLPAMSTQEFIAMKSALEQNPFFSYHNNFLFTEHFDDIFERFRLYLTVLTVLMLELAVCGFAIAFRHASPQVRRQSLFWMMVAVVSFLMAIPLTLPLWKVLLPLQKIQFPWRFNTTLTIATIALVALAVSTWKQSIPSVNKRLLEMTGIFLGVGLLLSAIALLPVQSKVITPWNRNVLLWSGLISVLALAVSSLRQPANFSRQRSLTIGILLTLTLLLSSGGVIKNCLMPPAKLAAQLAINRDAKEYRPRAVPEELYTDEALQQLVDRFNTSSDPHNAEAMQRIAQIQQRQPRKLVLQGRTPVDAWLTVKQFYYPGWSATLAGSTTSLPVQPSSLEGLLQVKVPRGEHQVILTLTTLISERAGQWISGISSVAILGLCFWFCRLDRQIPN